MSQPDSQYTMAVVGTGFASSFFLAHYLKHAGPDARILVLERGVHDTHKWQVQNRRSSSIPFQKTFTKEGHPDKEWVFTIGFGGGSNCWWGGTPRLMPNDFRLKSKYGVGRDWPLSYEELEPYYQAVEEAMSISGPPDGSPYPRSKPYPQPPHRFSDPDAMLKKAYPDKFFLQPTARSRVPMRGRGRCCANGVCHICPVNAKFTIQNGLPHVYKDPRVTLLLGATVETLDIKGQVASGVRFTHDGKEQRAAADMVVLGANAFFNPLVMMRSGMDDPLLGKRLHEQLSITIDVDLKGVDNFGASTVISGLAYTFYDGEHRRDRAACMIESWNKPDMLRPDFGKWRQLARYRLIFEDLPDDENHVKIDPAAPGRPIAYHKAPSSYAMRSIDALESLVPAKLLNPLPVERVNYNRWIEGTESHILGTTVMGNDASTSVIDRHLVHHNVRNLLVLGGGAFPTCSPANPTLTISALSLWAASNLTGSKL
ncbi:MAG TPA: GMC family oxidoreductase [Bryobacteraceae bacterium]|nr:GMC family oxidoreductase [Bryobacteraceae bacterium]